MLLRVCVWLVVRDCDVDCVELGVNVLDDVSVRLAVRLGLWL